MQTLDERMKGYEKSQTLPINIPIIIRLDGRAFHTLTRGMNRPFDDHFMNMMNCVAVKLCEQIQNARIAYIQSDEISILVYNRIESECWFANDVQKICSVSASIAGTVAMKFLQENPLPRTKNTMPTFDCRVNIYPEKDVNNYFIWRQRDNLKNAIQMVARYKFGHKALMNKNKDDMLKMLSGSWKILSNYYKNGRMVIKTKENVEIKNAHFTGMVEKNVWVVLNAILFNNDSDQFIESIMNDVDKEIIQKCSAISNEHIEGRCKSHLCGSKKGHDKIGCIEGSGGHVCTHCGVEF
jgi:tRNA(His) guanylyltransferase